MMMINQGTMMHRVINKAHMENFKQLIEEGNVYITANIRVIPEAQKYRPVENDKILNFMPTTNSKRDQRYRRYLKVQFQVHRQ